MLFVTTASKVRDGVAIIKAQFSPQNHSTVSSSFMARSSTGLRPHHNTSSVLLEQLAAWVTIVVSLQEVICVPGVKTRIILLLHGITLFTNTVHFSRQT